MTTSSSNAKTDDEQDAAPKTEETAEPEEETGAPEEETGGAGADADPTGDVDGQAAAATDAASEDTGDEPADTAPGTRSTVAAGAAAVVSAGLGLASLTGTWLSDQMSHRQELIGQINTTSQPVEPSEQIAAIYGSPAHTTALFNGFFAVAAVIVAGVTLLMLALTKNRGTSPVWVRAVASGGLVLGVVGLAIAAVMWFDVFTDPPAVPAVPAVPGA